jgi:three-Cys-motif partner protein
MPYDWDQPPHHSLAKADLVSRYFGAWAAIMAKQSPRIGYVDLWCGPGRFGDGSASTPLLILQAALKSPAISAKLECVFNDADGLAIAELRRNVNELPGIGQLVHEPKYLENRVEDGAADWLESTKLIPSLLFLDPFGYKGLSQKLICAGLKDWGCDCIYFFNYNNVNRFIGADVVREPMLELFGEERGAALVDELRRLPSGERERRIVSELIAASCEHVRCHAQTFRFLTDERQRTSHYLIFLSKHPLGHLKFKEEAARVGRCSPAGVPLFEYPKHDDQGELPLSDPLDDLVTALRLRFAGSTLSVESIIADHHVGTPYVARNYKAALKRLEAEGRIVVTGRQQRGSMPECAQVTFPRAGGEPRG